MVITKRFFYTNQLLLVTIALCAVVGLLLAFSTRIAQAATANDAKTGQRILTIHDGSKEVGVFTNASTLRQALKDANIAIDKHDKTEPDLDDELVASSYEVNIFRARPVVVKDGIVETKTMTPYYAPEQIAEQAKIELQKEDIVSLSLPTNILRDGVAEIMTIKRATPFTFKFYGKTNPAYTQEKTVGDMLEAKNIKLGPNDDLSVPRSAPIKPGMLVELWRNGKQVITEEKAVDFPVEKIQDANREAGFREVKTPGVKGMRTVTYEVVMKNGVEKSRRELQSVTTKEPKKQVEIVGTKSAFSGDLAGAFAALRGCESGGNYANKNNPKYRGAYQFGYETWGNYGGFYDPADAPPEVQDKAALELYQRDGWQPWPHCSSKLGLR